MKKIKKFIPDILFMLGIIMFSYNIFRPATEHGLFPSLPLPWTNYHTTGKVLGITLIALSLNIAIRRYLKSKNSQN